MHNKFHKFDWNNATFQQLYNQKVTEFLDNENIFFWSKDSTNVEQTIDQNLEILKKAFLKCARNAENITNKKKISTQKFEN